jgi:spore germination protein GerM
MSPRDKSNTDKSLLRTMAVAVIVLAAGLVSAVVAGDDGDDATVTEAADATTTTSTTTTMPTETTAATSTTSTTAALACAGRDAIDVDAAAGEQVVLLHFSCGDEVLPVARTIPAEERAVLSEAMRLLLAGPSEAERSAGFASVFSVPGVSLERVVIVDGTAVIGFSQSTATALANSPSNIAALSRQVLRTASQFPAVREVEIHFGGSCEAFAQWAQADDCVVSE